MDKSFTKYPLLFCLCLLTFSHYTFATNETERHSKSEIDWELILPQKVMQGTLCKWELAEEERLFIENSFY